MSNNKNNYNSPSQSNQHKYNLPLQQQTKRKPELTLTNVLAPISQQKAATQFIHETVTQTQTTKQSLNSGHELDQLGGKTDFMQTQTFHRRNMSNLINMKEDDEVPDHMLISRGGPPRRTLEQIEQGSNCAYGEEESLNEMMNSQESAAENDFQDLNSNFHPDEPQMPKGGFFDMVEHPSILDDDDDEADNYSDDEHHSSTSQQEGDYPHTGSNLGSDNLEEDEASQQLRDNNRVLPPQTPDRQNQRNLSPFDGKMELSELGRNSDANQGQNSLNASRQNQNLMVPNSATYYADAKQSPGDISQATNESCSSLDTMGQHNNESTQKEKIDTDRTPFEAYGADNKQPNHGCTAKIEQKDSRAQNRSSNKERPLHVYQYYPNNDDIDDSLDDDDVDQNQLNRNPSQSSSSRIINTESPSPQRDFKSSEPKDSDEADNKRQQAPPSAPKQSNFIQFEEVKDASQHQEDSQRQTEAYDMYGARKTSTEDQKDDNAPSLSREQQISSQKMLTPNEQRMHSSYFPADGAIQQALPSTKSYQTPGNCYGSTTKVNPFLQENEQARTPLKTSLIDETNSVSTANPQYYHHRQNGQIGFGQQSGVSRASDRIYDKAQMAGLSPEPQSNLDTIDLQSNSKLVEQEVLHQNNAKASQQEQKGDENSRVDEMNQIHSEGLRESAKTNDRSPELSQAQMQQIQSTETKVLSPEEYNLLAANDSIENLQVFEALNNTGGSQSQTSSSKLPQRNSLTKNNIHLQETADQDLNDRESPTSDDAQPIDPNPKLASGGSYNTDNQSRKLYVITEESQSMIGGQTIDLQKIIDATQGSQKMLKSGANLRGSGYGFLKASTKSQDLPAYEPPRRLTQGSSKTSGGDVRSMNYSGTPGQLDLQGSALQKSLNQTMGSPVVQKFNDQHYQNGDNQIINQQTISQAQIDQMNNFSDQSAAQLNLAHQRSKSQQTGQFINGEQSQRKDSPMTIPAKVKGNMTGIKENNGKSAGNQFVTFNVNQPELQSDQQNVKSSPILILEQNSSSQAHDRSKLQNPHLQFNASAAPRIEGQNDSDHLQAMQHDSYASTFKRDQELMSQYLKQTSTITMDRRFTQERSGVASGEGSKPNDFASDEDLLGSNFDRISKILPNHEQINEQLPDFNGDESVSNNQLKLMTQIRDLQQIIQQRNQIIVIKDNTIAEMKNEFGMRSSYIPSAHKAEDVKDVAVLALPDTKDAKCQTHGPRKQAYYKSIPAKVYTNLPNRSPSTSQERLHDGGGSFIAQNQSNGPTALRFNKKMQKQNSYQGQTPNKKKQLYNMSNSVSPGPRRSSPRQDSFPEVKTYEDAKSLRLQLVSLKNQLNAQEEDNMTLIEKVTALEDTIDTQEKNYDALQIELEERLALNDDLRDRNDELTKQVDCLLADNAELCQVSQVKSHSLKSDQMKRILQEKRKRDMNHFGTQTDIDNLTWQKFVKSLQPDQENRQINIDQFSSGQHSVSGSNTYNANFYRGQSALGAGLIGSREQSRNQDFLSDAAMSGEQGTGMAESERVQILLERANGYEQQQMRIEKEISQYKRLIQEVQGSSNEQKGPQPFNLGAVSPQDGQANANMQIQQNSSREDLHRRNMSNMSQITGQMMNIQDNMHSTQDYGTKSATMSFDFNKNSCQNLGTGPAIQSIAPVELQTYGTGQQTMNSVDIASLNQQQQIGFLQQQVNHHKRKGKKVAKRNERLEFEKLAHEKTINEMASKMQELNERYRDLRSKYQLKIQEKNLKISDLKSQLQRFILPGTPNPQSLTTHNTTQVQHIPGSFSAQHMVQQPHHGHVASYGELSSLQPHMTMVRSEEKIIQQVQQEDNKGDKASMRKLQKTQGLKSSQNMIDTSSISAVNQNHQDKSSFGLSNQGDFYQIVQGMVDQRIAERSQDKIMTQNIRLVDEQQSRSQSRKRKGSSNGRKRTDRPELAILKNNRGIFYEHSPSELLGSRNLVSSEGTEGQFSLAHPAKFEAENLARFEEINRPQNRQQFFVSNSSPTSVQLQQIQESRNSQSSAHNFSSFQSREVELKHRQTQPEQIKQRYIPTGQKKQAQTLAESYARKPKRRNRESEERGTSSPPTHQVAKRIRSGTKKGSRVRSKSSEKMDLTNKSTMSKDDVMPCYKYKIDGRKRNDVEYKPPVSLMSYLHPAQNFDENASSVGNRRYRSSSSSPTSSRKYPRAQRHSKGNSSQETKRRRQDAQVVYQKAHVQEQNQIQRQQEEIMAQGRIGQMLREAQMRDEANRQQNYRQWQHY